MKILNIDTFAQVKRQIVFKGTTHDVRETSVQQFIDNLKAAEELEKASQGAPETLSRQVELSIAAICDAIPTMKAEDLKTVPIEAITALLQFIRGELDPDTSGAPAPEAAGEDAQKKT